MPQIICFVSDFGLEDACVGVCHARIIEACPDARVVDLGHQISPFDIRKAAVTAASGVYQLPHAIHLVVVDPGVGSGRRDLCIVTTNGTRLVGPDNGVLIPAASRAGGVAEAVDIDPSKFGDSRPLATFHARDVLAPAAAELACGKSASTLGEQVDISTLVPAPFDECRMVGDSTVGEVLEADRFGSLRFNIPAEAVEGLRAEGAKLELLLGHNSLVVPFGLTFADAAPGGPVALIDSSGWLTLALNTDSAIERYNAQPGTAVHIRVVGA